MKRIHLLILFTLFATSLSAQLLDDMEDEGKLYAESKQVNQFFRRFNGEEDEKGNRYYAHDKNYRNPKLRKKYLAILFNEANNSLTPALKTEFAKQVLDNTEASFLNFHGPNWFSEVHAVFTYHGKDQPITLFMELEKSHQGYKWVIQKVHADLFEPYYRRDTLKVGQFLHPLSHELDFMNMRKAFLEKDSIQQFTAKHFVPDHLSLLVYEMKRGNLTFKSVNEVKFHFFQLDGWYFEVANFNRPGYNTGWLISNLVKLPTTTDKALLQRYLYHETN